jgi:predicted Fe-Mo cluster-binding NifX family protein
MNLIISAQQTKLESPLDDRFGRSPWLIEMDTETKQWEAFPNPGASQSGGAGVAAAQFVIDHKANAVISGDFGPHAVSAFQAANIKMYLFTRDVTTVQQAIDYFKQDKLPIFHQTIHRS